MTMETKNFPIVDINIVRREVVAKTFKMSTGKNVLILTAESPFIIIGKIVAVEGDYIFIKAETTNVDQFEGKVIRTHINRIMVFHIETAEYPIPRLHTNERPNEWRDSK